MTEYELISLIAGKFPRSKHQGNELFECDAELVRLGGCWWGLTMDEFSQEEDLFTSESSERLGENLATATLSDLLAAGVEPEFFLQSLILPRDSEMAFVKGISKGIRRVLAESNCYLLGGDIGCSNTWRFCGFAMGRVRGKKALTRVIPKSIQTLWVTGKLGDANLAALKGLSTPRFEFRLKEARSIWKYACSCIDTSGGLMDALWNLHVSNPSLRFEVDLDAVPLATEIFPCIKTSGIIAEAFLLGGAGEYELLFTTPADLKSCFVKKLTTSGAVLIGKVYPDKKSGVFLNRGGITAVRLNEAPPCAREARSMKKYIRNVLEISSRLFSQNSRHK